MPVAENSSVLKGANMELGNFSVSLAVKGIKASRHFYEKPGFSVFTGDESQSWLIMKNGDTTIIGLLKLPLQSTQRADFLGTSKTSCRAVEATHSDPPRPLRSGRIGVVDLFTDGRVVEPQPGSRIDHGLRLMGQP
jgi:hypothetical protein